MEPFINDSFMSCDSTNHGCTHAPARYLALSLFKEVIEKFKAASAEEVLVR